MRWFIVFLIVANVILFFWVQQQSRPLPGSSALPPPDIGRLRLATELENQQNIVDSAPPAPAPDELAASEDAPVAGSEGPEEDAEVLPKPAVVPVAVELAPEAESEGPPEQSAPLIPVAARAAATETDDPVDAVIVAADQSVAQALQAAEEIADGESDEPVPPVEVGAEEPSADVEPAVVEADNAVCARVGPFDPEDADKLISALPANLQVISDVAEEYDRVDRYYVLIPALPSRAAGRQKLKELADAGFTDTWLFPSGRYRNAISLGFFSRESGAKRHAANIARKGFVTEVKGRTSVRQRRWLLLQNPDGRDPGAGLRLPAEVRVEPQTCP